MTIKKETLERTFKNYDIRGIADTDITEEYAYAVGNAFGQKYAPKRCAVGRDGRRTSEQLMTSLTEGLRDAGVDVVDIGLVSTPQIKWIVAEHELPAGIMVTASHNPPEYNGFKFIGPGGLAIGEDAGLHDLKPLMDSAVRNDKGALSEHSYLDEFIKFTMKTLPASERPVFIDGSGGMIGPEIQRLSELGDYTFVLYNTELDPEFSEHSPNPLEPEATEAAREFCGMHRCIGVVFDADGDRSIFIDEEGKEVPGDYFGAWLVARTFNKGDGATSTVRDSRAVRDAVLAKEGKFMLGKVGHANIQKLMHENDLRLGTEKSGHVFFKESHTAENGLMGMLLVLKHLREGEKLSDGVSVLREEYLSSPEINFKVKDRKLVIQVASEHYRNRGELNMMDGILCEGDGWWVNLRPSNTEPLVRLTFEAPDKETYDSLKTEAEQLLKPYLAE